MNTSFRDDKKAVCDRSTALFSIKRLTRRPVLQLMGFGLLSLHIYPVLATQESKMKEPQVLGTEKLTSGVRIQDVVQGEGREAHEGDLVQVNYVCRRSNGYFVHSTVDQFSGESAPVILSLNDKQVINFLTCMSLSSTRSIIQVVIIYWPFFFIDYKWPQGSTGRYEGWRYDNILLVVGMYML
jgi:hypothetical protein